MRPSNPGSPPSSSRSLPEFACVAQSAAMRKFIEDIASCAEQKRAIPLYVGPNTLELSSFIRLVAAHVRPVDRPKGLIDEMMKIVQEEHPPLTHDLLDGAASGLVFLKGDTIPTPIQHALALARFRRIDLFLAVVSYDARDLVKIGKWNEMFYRQFSRTFFWPEWSQRSDDHGTLIAQMTTRLQATRRSATDLSPELDESAVDFLRSTPYKGVDDAYKTLQKGYHVFEERQPAFAITAEHIAGDSLRALSSGRRAESSVPPSN